MWRLPCPHLVSLEVARSQDQTELRVERSLRQSFHAAEYHAVTVTWGGEVNLKVRFRGPGLQRYGRGNMNDLRGELSQYFATILAEIDAGRIVKEEDLALFVPPTAYPYALTRNLLTILGYDSAQVKGQHGVRLAASTYRVDYRVETGTQPWLLELKAPTESCGEHLKQLRDYFFGSPDVPLGVLFNGKEARVYVNTSHKGLKTYESDLGLEPVRMADTRQASQLVDIFAPLAWSGSMLDTLPLARQWAKARRAKIAADKRSKARKATVQAAVDELLSDPQDDLLEKALECSAKLKELQATVDDIRDAWLARLHRQPKQAFPDNVKINPTMRALVARVCGKIGYEALHNLRIRGLYLYTGDKASMRGTPVEPGPGVPDGLSVAAVDRPSGERIIATLNEVLSRE